MYPFTDDRSGASPGFGVSCRASLYPLREIAERIRGMDLGEDRESVQAYVSRPEHRLLAGVAMVSLVSMDVSTSWRPR